MRTTHWCSPDCGILSIRRIPNVLDDGFGRELVEPAAFRIRPHILASALDGGYRYRILVLVLRTLGSKPLR
jgi:hypothetical protein